MTRRDIASAAAGALAGLLVASAAWSLQKPATHAKADPSVATPGGDDIESLRKANEKLVESLADADRTIAALREQTGTPAPPPRPDDRPATNDDAGRRGRRARGEPTAEDWERMAQVGAVRVQVPCMRDKPWTPNARVLDRLGLAPGDANTIRDAYAASNKRMADQIKPLCVKALGSAEAADRVGPKACSDAILSGAKRTDPEGTQKSLVRVAELNAGKGDSKPAADQNGVEQLLMAMSKEGKTFEADLAAKLGPEEAKRLAWAPEMCSDRTTVRAKDEDPADDAAGGPARRGGRGNR
jgi:hypothetical protein